MYKAKFLQPQPRTGPDTVLHLKLHDGPNWKTAGPTLHAFDYSLNSHPGTLQGTAAYKYPGVDLDGDSDYIEVAHHADFSFDGAPFSISLWVNHEGVSFFPILRKGVIGTDGEFCLAIALFRNAIHFCLYDKDDQTKYIGQGNETTLSADRWYHIVVTYDGGILASGIKTYLDGVKEARNDDVSAGDFAAMDGNHAIWIGRGDTTTGSEYANGLIDDVMIHKKELSAAEALDIYNLTKWRYGR